jgi:hypothetical protein
MMNETSLSPAFVPLTLRSGGGCRFGVESDLLLAGFDVPGRRGAKRESAKIEH